MSHFVVTYTHPDPAGWAKHMQPHLDWIIAQVEAGRLRASGPIVGVDRTSILIFNVPDRDSLQELLDTDPFVIEGQVGDLTVIEWDPIFGVFHDDSSRLSYSEILDMFPEQPRRAV